MAPPPPPPPPAPPTATKLCDKTAASSPCALGAYVWFQGLDNLLWRTRADGSGSAINPHGLKCLSTPTAALDGRVYFQGEDNALMVVEQDTPWLYAKLNSKECSGPPIVPPDGMVYFCSGTGVVQQSTRNAKSGYFPLKSDQANDHTQMVSLDHVLDGRTLVFCSFAIKKNLHIAPFPPRGSPHSDVSPIDAVVVRRNNKAYVVRNDNIYIEVSRSDAKLKQDNIMYFCVTTPIESKIGDDGNLYWISSPNELLKAPQSSLATKKLLGYSTVRPDVPGDGYVYFRGTDNYIYRAAIPA